MLYLLMMGISEEWGAYSENITIQVGYSGVLKNSVTSDRDLSSVLIKYSRSRLSWFKICRRIPLPDSPQIVGVRREGWHLEAITLFKCVAPGRRAKVYNVDNQICIGNHFPEHFAWNNSRFERAKRYCSILFAISTNCYLLYTKDRHKDRDIAENASDY